MTAVRITSRGLIVAILCGAATAGVLFACTLTQSLDYLQKGDGGAVVAPGIEGGPPAGDGGPDGGGQAAPVWEVTGLTKPGFLVLDPTSAYWITDGKVVSVPKAAGGTPKVLGTVPPNTSALAADSDPAGFVFAAVGSDVLRMPKDGSGAAGNVVVFAPGAGATPVDTIGADSTSLFVLQYSVTGAGADARILRMANDGGGPADISGDGGAQTMTLDPASVVWLGADPGKSQFVQHAKGAPADVNTAIFSLGPDDGLPTLSSDIAVDDAFLYWITSDATAVTRLIVSRKRNPSASVVTIYLGRADDALAHLAVDDKYAYAIETHTSSLLRVPKTGGDPVVLLSGLKQPTALAVDATGIYVAEAVVGMTGRVFKIAR
jgi:hypothetical protein